MTQGFEGSGPPIFDLQGSNQRVGPPITPKQSRVQRRTIFANVGLIDCVVGAVVEQFYSGVVTCSRDNTRQRHQYIVNVKINVKVTAMNNSTNNYKNAENRYSKFNYN